MHLIATGERYLRPCAAAVGFFDGVHRGHQYLLGQVRAEAAARGLDAVAVTFEQHPRMTLSPDCRPQLLTDNDEKAALLAEAGMDACAFLRFDRELAALSAREFMRDCLLAALSVRCLVVGYDHRFGSRRSEGFAQYVAYGRELGIDVVRARSYSCGDITVSSSAVRRFLAGGNVEMAKLCLGRPYALSGTVVHGHAVGRDLGFPTANLRPDNAEKVVPARGVYAARAVLGTETFPAMLNIGERPTLGNGSETTVEAHLLGFDDSLYGRRLTLLFERRLREERRFPSLDALREQLKDDAALTLKLLAP